MRFPTRVRPFERRSLKY